MVVRAERGEKFKRWPMNSREASNKTLREVAANMTRVEIIFREVSKNRVELVWPHVVTSCSAARLVRLAKEANANFEISGEPSGIADDEAVEEVSYPDPDKFEEVVSPEKRRRLVDIEPTEVESAPAEDNFAQSMLDQPRRFPQQLLLLKCEYMCRVVAHVGIEHPQKYSVDREQKLGSGTFGTVCAVSKRPTSSEPLAIKLFDRGRLEHRDCASVRAADAEVEVRRYVSLQGHPNLLQLLDVEVSRRRLGDMPAIGLVFQRYDSDVGQFLQKRPFTLSGMRHVLRSTLAALVDMHGHGLLHADLKPANILLRGLGSVRNGWRNLVPKGAASSVAASSVAASAVAASAVAASAVAASADENELEITYRLPAAFEVTFSTSIA